MRIPELTEFPHSNREVDYEIYFGSQAQLPLCYALPRKPDNKKTGPKARLKTCMWLWAQAAALSSRYGSKRP